MHALLLVWVVVAAALVLSSHAQTAPTWARRNPSSGPSPPKRQMGLLAAWPSQNSLILFGGEDPDSGNSRRDVWQFDLTTDTWSELVPASGTTIPARFSFVGGVDDAAGALVVHGGENKDGDVFADAWRFDLSTRVWTRISDGGEANAPELRYGAAGGVVSVGGDAFLLVSHGFDLGTRWKNSFALRLSDNTWFDITPSSGDIPTARCLVAGAALAEGSGNVRLAMYGGCGSGGYGPCPSSEAWMLTVTGLTSGAATPSARWAGPGPTCLRARNYGAMAADAAFESGSFFLYGGAPGVLVASDPEGQLNSASLGASDPLLWRQTTLQAASANSGVPGQPSSNRQQAQMATLGGALFLMLADSRSLWTVDYAGAGVTPLSALPIEECNADPIPAFRAAHGALMGIAWGVMVPLAVLIARFGHAWDPLWFKLHRGLNALALLMGVAGLIIAFLMVSAGNFLSGAHAFIGVGVVAFGLQQPLNAACRPHKGGGGEDKSKGRRRWELWHKNTGRLALVLGMVNPISGLSFLVGTGSPGFAVYVAWFAVYVLVYAYLTARGLPFEKNGPSTLAQFVNERLCCFLSPWNDNFKPRNGPIDDTSKA